MFKRNLEKVALPYLPCVKTANFNDLKKKVKGGVHRHIFLKASSTYE